MRHETSGTGLEPRLLLGPMSEDGDFLWMNELPTPVREYDQILSSDVKIKKVCSNNGEYTHTITCSKKNISKVLEYQTWSASSATLNNNRIVKEVKATTWAKRVFRKVEDGSLDNLSPDCDVVKLAYDPVICPNGKKYPNSTTAGCAGQTNCKPFYDVPYTPTTVMELDDGECPYHHKANKHAECRHVFVIKRAKVNKCGQVVFYVSSKDIILPSDPDKELKLLKTIPTGSFCKARFDIDSTRSVTTPPASRNETAYYQCTTDQDLQTVTRTQDNLTTLCNDLCTYTLCQIEAAQYGGSTFRTFCNNVHLMGSQSKSTDFTTYLSSIFQLIFE